MLADHTGKWAANLEAEVAAPDEQAAKEDDMRSMA